MARISIIIDISSEHDDYGCSLREAMLGILDGNRMGRGENDTDSYEWAITHIYD